MKKLITTAVAGLALAALPLAAADAKPGKGRGGDRHANSNADSGADRGDRREERRTARRCKKARRVGFAVRGTLAGATDEDVTLTVARANRHARSFIEGDTHTFALDGARLKFEGVTDADGDDDVDLADVQPTDEVRVTGKVVRPKRGCEAEPRVIVRKIHVERPEAGDEDEQTDES